MIDSTDVPSSSEGIVLLEVRLQLLRRDAEVSFPESARTDDIRTFVNMEMIAYVRFSDGAAFVQPFANQDNHEYVHVCELDPSFRPPRL